MVQATVREHPAKCTVHVLHHPGTYLSQCVSYAYRSADIWPLPSNLFKIPWSTFPEMVFQGDLPSCHPNPPSTMAILRPTKSTHCAHWERADGIRALSSQMSQQSCHTTFLPFECPPMQSRDPLSLAFLRHHKLYIKHRRRNSRLSTNHSLSPQLLNQHIVARRLANSLQVSQARHTPLESVPRSSLAVLRASARPWLVV